MFRLCFLSLLCLSLPVEAMSSEEALAQVKYFSLGYNGFATKKSEGELLYQQILSAKNNEEIFFKLIRSDKATNEGKLYAACGLWAVNNKQLDKIIPAQGIVTLLQGDILRQEDFGEAFSRIKRTGCSQ